MIYERMRVPSNPRGGALPTYQRQSTNYVPGSGVSARIDDSAARIAGAGGDAEARALAGLGKAVKGAVDVGVRAYDDYSKSKATQLLTEYRRTMNQALYGDGGILTKQGEAAIDADQQRGTLARKLRGELLKQTNESTQYYFNHFADEYDADTSLKAQKYGSEQRIVMLNRNDEAASQERAEFAMGRYVNQQDFDRGVGEALWHAEQLMRRKGYSGEALGRGLKEFSSKIFAGSIQQALANGDIQSAERLLSKGSRIYGDGESAYSRMTAPDIADAKLRIQAKREALQAKAEARRKKAEQDAEKAEINAKFSDISALLESFPLERQEAEAQLLVDRMEKNPEIRNKLLERVSEQIKWKQDVHDANVTRGVLLAEEMRRTNGWSYTQALEYVDGRENISDEVKVELEKRYAKIFEANKEESARRLIALREEIDTQRGKMTEADLLTSLKRLDMTPSHQKEAVDYFQRKGKYGEVTQFRFNKAWEGVYGKKDKPNATDYDVFLSLWPDGAAWNEDQAKELALAMKTKGTVGDSFFNGTTLRESVKKGTEADFLPNVDSDRNDFIDAEIQHSVSLDAWKRLRKDDKEFLRALWLREHEYGMGIPSGNTDIGKRLEEIRKRMEGGR